MTDQIPADKVREILEEWERIKEYADWDDLDTLVKDIRDLLPPPPRPTLADMNDDERAACRWMQCDVTGFQGQLVLATTCDDDDEAGLVAACGEVVWSSLAQVTPRPDLPRLTWPGDTPAPAPAPALPDGWRLADHPHYGRVIVTNPTPNLSGRVYFVLHVVDDDMGYDWHSCPASELTYIDGPESPAPVPPNTLSVGSEWDDADALALACRESGRDQITVTDRDGDVSVWSAVSGWWETWGPTDGFEPYTILHTGKGAGQ